MLKYFYIAIAISSICLVDIAVAVAPVDPCHQAIIAGDTNFTPYAIDQEGNYVGVGYDLAKIVFDELDIPTINTDLGDKHSVIQGLQVGDIDILINVYHQNELEGIAKLLTPGYAKDDIVVTMRTGKAELVKRWDDLIGQRGIVTEFFMIPQQFTDYADKYLYLQSQGSLQNSIEYIYKNKADYMLGSRKQLEYAIKRQGVADDLLILPKISVPSTVHMAVSKRSKCYIYHYYLQKRLSQLAEDGTVKGLFDNYKQHTKNKELELDKEFDFLFDLTN